MCQRCLMNQICNQWRRQCGGNPFFWGGIGIVRCCGNNGWNGQSRCCSDWNNNDSSCCS